MDDAIFIRELRMSFGEREVLRGLNLAVPRGQIVGYVGPNGAGKSTTVKILAGLLGGYGGTARVCGLELAQHPLQVKRRIGYVPEQAHLYEGLTPREMLSFVGSVHGLQAEVLRDRIEGLLQLQDLEPALDQPIAELSKGMRQKVLITSALMHDPEVLFFDEPLSGLDAPSVTRFKALLAALAAQGKTLFYCSHVLDVVERVCDRVVVLSEGRIVADGTLDQLRRQYSEPGADAGELPHGSAADTEATLESLISRLTGAGDDQAFARNFLETMGLRGDDAS